MKHLYLLLAVTILLPLIGGCALINDVPRHTADEVINVVQSFSPDCRVEVSPQKGGG